MCKTCVMMKMNVYCILLGFSFAGIFAFEKEARQDRPTAEYRILQKWDLPEELDEISGIDWMDNNTIAAVQDEDGIIFIMTLKN